jgi:hypothetical protein
MQLRFTWSYRDDTFEAAGDGIVRTQAPDRARLDFFLRNGAAGGYAILIGDSLDVPGIDLVRRFLPPVPLLWATLGRVVVPSAIDTLARQRGDTLGVDIGVLGGGDASRARGRVWRVAFVGRDVVRAERIEESKVHEWVSRGRGREGQWILEYAQERARRSLRIAVTDTTLVESFDASIWRKP